jgi:1-deoxy-D-xylulose-5-phosphate reductoisomerase
MDEGAAEARGAGAKRRVIVLGATGSIGGQALEVIERSPDLELVGLSAHSSWEGAVAAARSHGLDTIAIGDPQAARLAAAETGATVLGGPEAESELLGAVEADLVLNAIVGIAGLRPTMRALELGLPLALANKETLVAGGDLIAPLVDRGTLVPVDSEHSALHQLLSVEGGRELRRLVITASGGPLRGKPAAEVAGAGLEQALNHPNWNMGAKNTIDSATLMNKGLEVIEAHHLIGLPYDRIDVLVHPTSIVHGLVVLEDGSVLAHLGVTDMRMAISYALNHPRRVDIGVADLDLVGASPLEFEPVDREAFPGLDLSIAAGETGGTAPCVLNAANEVAVAAFLAGRTRLGDIPAVVEETLAAVPAVPVESVETLLAVDAEARSHAAALTERRVEARSG